ncbi:MAG: hypothetical protein HUJ42_01720 [Malacoplasma sp.]|nr:hypothetical protein [Malacoplasma sp.]
MKFTMKKIFKFLLPVTAVVLTPVIATSCSNVETTSAKQLDSTSWNNGNVKYSELSNSNVSIRDAVYGSNFNNGNYIFLYGSLANSDFANFLYGNGNNGLGNQTVNEQNFSSSVFFTNFFNSILANPNNGFGYTVSFLMYVDMPPYNGDANSDTNALSGYNLPNDQYTADEALTIANGGSDPTAGTYTQTTLPENYQLMVGNYKRNDQSAITYRDIVKYVETIRPNLASTAVDGGIIAFKKNKNPKSFSISDSILSDLITYYTPSAND